MASKKGLTGEIALQIIDLLLGARAEMGTHLKEARFAGELGVSRTPVREALAVLERAGVVEKVPNRGFFLVADPAALEAARGRLAKESSADLHYLQIARDRLAGRLPDEFSVNELAERYGVSRSQVLTLLARMAKEGWVEKMRGYGWRFLPVLTSLDAHRQSVRFRLAIEPAALREPGFRVDPAAFNRARQEQKRLLESDLTRISAVELFEIGSSFHEMLMRCSGNVFFLESLQRVNRLRRLLEYKAMDDPTLYRRQCEEHLQMLDLLEAGRMEEAAECMARHLEEVGSLKADVLRGETARSEADAGLGGRGATRTRGYAARSATAETKTTAK